MCILPERAGHLVVNLPGFGSVAAFSGQKMGRDNSRYESKDDIGPIPEGTYYIVDRQAGGRMGWLYDLWSAYGWGTTDRTGWFALMNPETGDETLIDGVRRGHFRLHPMGPLRLSEGCITVIDPVSFGKLASFLREHGANTPIPGGGMAYGTVEVR